METEKNRISGEGNVGASVSAEETNVFVDSVGEITPDMLNSEKPVKKNNKLISEAIRICFLAIVGTVFIISLSTVIRSLIDYERGRDIYDPISENVFDTLLGGDRAVSLSRQAKRSPVMLDYNASKTSAPSNSAEEPEISHRFEIMQSNLNYFRSINPDIYGYINAEGTKISYPIVKAEDNDYYLNRAWNREYLVVGSIFADFRSDKDITKNRNTIFYGHNMNDGSMFNNVMKFLEKEVFDSTTIEVYTLDGIYVYQPFAVYKTVYTDPYIQTEFLGDEDFIAFCERARSKSEVECDMTFDADDTIITLSTCTPDDDVEYAFRGRYALHAKLIRVDH